MPAEFCSRRLSFKGVLHNVYFLSIDKERLFVLYYILDNYKQNWGCPLFEKVSDVCRNGGSLPFFFRLHFF